MAVSKKVVSAIMLVVVIACMSGYLAFIPKILTKMGIITTTGAVTDIVNSKIESNVSTWDQFIELKNKVEKKLNDVAFKYQFIEFSGLLNLITDKNIIFDADPNSNVYRLNNGYLTTINTNNDSIGMKAQNIIDLNNYLIKTKRNFLYVQAPHKNNKFNTLIPDGIIDYFNVHTDEFISEINTGGVDCIDLRQEMYDMNINQYEMFFKTDHHWIPEAGLWTASVIFKHLNEIYKYNIPVNIANIYNFNIEVYKEIFLGSLGKRTGMLYGGLDDISLIYPKFETNLKFSIPSKDIYKEGDFYNTIFNFDHLQYDYYNKSPYSVYTGGDFPLNIIENKEGNGKKALLIRDSFACVTAPFLSLGFSELHIFDIRHNSESTVYDYIDYYNPDIVIVLYNCSMLGSEFMFQFDKISEQALSQIG